MQRRFEIFSASITEEPGTQVPGTVSHPPGSGGFAAPQGTGFQSPQVELLARLNIPENLWSLAPNTFSGGEQQRVNIAHCFVNDYPILLLDEPTAALDPENRQAVVNLIRNAKARGAALVGIFHDAETREAIGTHRHDMTTGQLVSSAT